MSSQGQEEQEKAGSCGFKEVPRPQPEVCDSLLLGDSATPRVSATLSTHYCLASLPSTLCVFSAS